MRRVTDDDAAGADLLRPVTLREVAEAAGVHISTASRALRRAASDGRASRSRESDLRIADIARRLGYTPDPNAASLTTRRSNAFGVVVPRLTDVVLSAVYDAIEETANRMSYDTFVANSHDDPVQQRRRIELLIGRRVDGVILGDARLDGANLSALERSRVPFVLVSRRHPDHLSVSGDDHDGGRQVGAHLASLGHERVGIVAGSPWASTSRDRVDGCIEALAEAGVEVPEHRVVEAGFDAEDGHRGMAELLALPDRPTAVFAVNDFAAIGALGALREAGLRPGHDVAVAGYNDITVARELTVPLTTVGSPLRAMGVRSAETLLALVHGLPVSSTVLPTRLVVRESTVPR